MRSWIIWTKWRWRVSFWVRYTQYKLTRQAHWNWPPLILNSGLRVIYKLFWTERTERVIFDSIFYHILSQIWNAILFAPKIWLIGAKIYSKIYYKHSCSDSYSHFCCGSGCMKWQWAVNLTHDLFFVKVTIQTKSCPNIYNKHYK